MNLCWNSIHHPSLLLAWRLLTINGDPLQYLGLCHDYSPLLTCWQYPHVETGHISGMTQSPHPLIYHVSSIVTHRVDGPVGGGSCEGPGVLLVRARPACRTSHGRVGRFEELSTTIVVIVVNGWSQQRWRCKLITDQYLPPGRYIGGTSIDGLFPIIAVSSGWHGQCDCSMRPIGWPSGWADPVPRTWQDSCPPKSGRWSYDWYLRTGTMIV